MNAIADFHFLRPAWLLLLPALWIALWTWRRTASTSAWASLIDADLLPVLQSAVQAASRWSMPALLIASTLLSLALAGPSWQRIAQPVYQAPAARVLVIDLSRSMDAADLKPSRLLRAKIAATELLQSQRDGDAGLAVFAQDAFAVVPLSSDRATVRHLLQSLSTELPPRQGSRCSVGIDQGIALLEQAGASRGEIVLITDSQPDRAAADSAARARSAGFALHVIGVGTSQGAPIPLPAGGWVKNASGGIELAKLPEAELQRLASQGGGRYHRIGSGETNWALVSGGPGTTADAHSTPVWRDDGPWLLLPLLALAALAFRPGWLPVVLLLVLPLSPAQAGWWQTPDQQGKALLDGGEHGSAAETFADPRWQATALYRAGDYTAAAERLAAFDDAQAHYNRGNALARAGDLDGAINAFEQALALEPDHADAQHNRDVVQQIKQQQEQESSPSESESDGEDSQPKPGEGDPSAGESEPDDADAPPQPDQTGENSAPPSPAPPAEQSDEATPAESDDDEDPSDDNGKADATAADTPQDAPPLDEQSLAVQQWLNRIPDDPGGLLRRKFQYLQQQRESGNEAEQAW